jgi:hypothetical protein
MKKMFLISHTYGKEVQDPGLQTPIHLGFIDTCHLPFKQ